MQDPHSYTDNNQCTMCQTQIRERDLEVLTPRNTQGSKIRFEPVETEEPDPSGGIEAGDADEAARVESQGGEEEEDEEEESDDEARQPLVSDPGDEIGGEEVDVRALGLGFVGAGFAGVGEIGVGVRTAEGESAIEHRRRSFG